MKPIITPLNFSYTYKRPTSEIWVLNTKDIPVNQALIKDTQIVYLSPQSVGGNHKHPRIEWFIGIGDLDFLWLDERETLHIEKMHRNDQLMLIEVPTFLPHAVRNNSADKSGILFEYASDQMQLVEYCKII